MGRVYGTKYTLLRERRENQKINVHIHARSSLMQHALFCSSALVIQCTRAEEDCCQSFRINFCRVSYRVRVLPIKRSNADDCSRRFLGHPMFAMTLGPLTPGPVRRSESVQRMQRHFLVSPLDSSTVQSEDQHQSWILPPVVLVEHRAKMVRIQSMTASDVQISHIIETIVLTLKDSIATEQYRALSGDWSLRQFYIVDIYWFGQERRKRSVHI